MEKKYKIWSIEHEQWWMPNRCGYTTLFEQAGVYSFDEAMEIVLGANMRMIGRIKPSEAMVPIKECQDEGELDSESEMHKRMADSESDNLKNVKPEDIPR